MVGLSLTWRTYGQKYQLTSSQEYLVWWTCSNAKNCYRGPYTASGWQQYVGVRLLGIINPPFWTPYPTLFSHSIDQTPVPLKLLYPMVLPLYLCLNSTLNPDWICLLEILRRKRNRSRLKAEMLVTADDNRWKGPWNSVSILLKASRQSSLGTEDHCRKWYSRRQVVDLYRD
jgi:hypothetical protein